MKKMTCALLIATMGGAAFAAEKKTPQRLLRHVVLLKFKDGTAPEQVRAIENEFLALKKKIPLIKCIEGGEDVSPEKLQNGFTHCFIVTFENEAGRDNYIAHQDHQQFVAFMKPDLEKVLVVDFWNKRKP